MDPTFVPRRPGLLVAAPHSGSGKTLATLALLALLRRRGVAVRAAKAGPDYIDPAFHAAALGRPSVNLDPWAMRPALIETLAAGDGPLLVEGMMGLFDGAADGSGSAADLAVRLGLPVVLVVDCARQSHSLGALLRGFRDHRLDVAIAGAMLNRVGSARHAAMLREAADAVGVEVLAALPARPDLAVPSRHLGLVQASEQADLPRLLEAAADWMEAGLVPGTLETLLAGAPVPAPAAPAATLPPLGSRIAVARDRAFAFSYPHLLDGWRRAGAEIRVFSPLADEAPDASADAVFLPGGYPELHAGRLAAAGRFRAGMAAARDRGALVYGECGGFMALGETLVDAGGTAHRMLGLLALETSFAEPRRHLGYRQVALRPGGPLPWPARLRGHEFHYAATVRAEGEPLFAVRDALGEDLGATGLRTERVCGSFLHVVDEAGA